MGVFRRTRRDVSIAVRLRWALLLGVGVVAASLIPASAARASTIGIDTTPSWNGSSSVSPFGYPGTGHGRPTATYGQTVTAPAGATDLTSFTFYMDQPSPGTPLVFRGEVYAWMNGQATGPALYESSPVSLTATGVFQPITFNTASIPVTPGTQYVLFATISRDYSAGATLVWGAIGQDVYSGGNFVYLNNGNNTSAWTGQTWATQASNDLAFKASFTAVDNDLSLTGVPGDQTVNATSPNGATVSYPQPTATDENLGTVSVNCTPASGSTFAIGTTTVTCTAADTDGDTNSPVTATFNVIVRGAADQLNDLAAASQGVGPGTSLGDKVAIAQADLAAGQTSVACGDLTGYINEVNAQAGKHIDPLTAGQLVAAARQIQAVLGCS